MPVPGYDANGYPIMPYRDPYAPVLLGGGASRTSVAPVAPAPVTVRQSPSPVTSSYSSYTSTPTSGGGGSSFVPQPPPSFASYNVTPLSINTSRDPGIEQTYGDVRKYREDLSAGTDRDAVNAIMRQRDVVSGLAKEVGQERALATGGAGSGAANQAVTDVYTQGGRDISGLNASLAAGGRQAQLAALGEQGNVASAGAADLAQKNNFALNTWQAQRQAEQARADSVNAAQQAQWSANLQLAALAFTG